MTSIEVARAALLNTNYDAATDLHTLAQEMNTLDTVRVMICSTKLQVTLLTGLHFRIHASCIMESEGENINIGKKQIANLMAFSIVIASKNGS